MNNSHFQPNPDNVSALLELGNRFDIPFLIKDCERHLKLRYDLKAIDKFLLADKYGLMDLLVATMGEIEVNDELRKTLGEKREVLKKRTWETVALCLL